MAVRIAGMLIALAVAVPAAAQPAPAAPTMTLTALDYIEIQQLVAREARALATSANKRLD
jgi:hypothetical protein